MSLYKEYMDRVSLDEAQQKVLLEAVLKAEATQNEEKSSETKVRVMPQKMRTLRRLAAVAAAVSIVLLAGGIASRNPKQLSGNGADRYRSPELTEQRYSVAEIAEEEYAAKNDDVLPAETAQQMPEMVIETKDGSSGNTADAAASVKKALYGSLCEKIGASTIEQGAKPDEQKEAVLYLETSEKDGILILLADGRSVRYESNLKTLTLLTEEKTLSLTEEECAYLDGLVSALMSE